MASRALPTARVSLKGAKSLRRGNPWLYRTELPEPPNVKTHGSVVAVHNASAEPVTVPLTLDDLEPGTVLLDLLTGGSVEPDEQGSVEVDLGAYGYRWLRVTPPGSRRLR